MSDAIKMRKVNFLTSIPIEAYGGGGFRFANLLHKGALLCLPSGFYSAQFNPNDIKKNNFKELLEHKSEVDLLLIGSGEQIINLSDEIKNYLRTQEIICEVMSTSAAVRTYNVLIAEERRVAALLFPV